MKITILTLKHYRRPRPGSKKGKARGTIPSWKRFGEVLAKAWDSVLEVGGALGPARGLPHNFTPPTCPPPAQDAALRQRVADLKAQVTDLLEHNTKEMGRRRAAEVARDRAFERVLKVEADNRRQESNNRAAEASLERALGSLTTLEKERDRWKAIAGGEGPRFQTFNGVPFGEVSAMMDYAHAHGYPVAHGSTVKDLLHAKNVELSAKDKDLREAKHLLADEIVKSKELARQAGDANVRAARLEEQVKDCKRLNGEMAGRMGTAEQKAHDLGLELAEAKEGHENAHSVAWKRHEELEKAKLFLAEQLQTNKILTAQLDQARAELAEVRDEWHKDACARDEAYKALQELKESLNAQAVNLAGKLKKEQRFSSDLRYALKDALDGKTRAEKLAESMRVDKVNRDTVDRRNLKVQTFLRSIEWSGLTRSKPCCPACKGMGKVHKVNCPMASMLRGSISNA